MTTPPRPSSRWAPPHPVAISRVALPTVGFWLAKGLSTAMGEAVSDWSVKALVPEIAVLLGFLAFAVALIVQLRCRRYFPWAYWATAGRCA